MIATAGKDTTVCVWRQDDAGRFECVARTGGHTEGVGCVAFARRSGRFFVSGSSDKTIKLWDVSALPKKASGMHQSRSIIVFCLR